MCRRLCVCTRVREYSMDDSVVLRVSTVMWLSGMHGNRYRTPLWASGWQKQLIWWISRNCSVSVCQSLINVRRLISVEGCSRSCWAGNMSSCVVGCIAGCQALSGVCVFVFVTTFSFTSTCWFLHEHQCIFGSLLCVCVYVCVTTSVPSSSPPRWVGLLCLLCW